MTPRIIRDNFSHLYGEAQLPVLEEIFRWELTQHPSLREKLFKIVKHDRDIWQATSVHDLPLFKEVSEGEAYSFESPDQGAAKTLVIKKYGLGFSISEEAVDDGKFQWIADMVAKLAKSARASQEINAMNVFNNAFTTELTADGVSLCNSAHPLPSGGSFRNILSTPADLSDASLKQAVTDFQTVFIGNTGIPYRMVPRTLLVHPDNLHLALEIVGSSLSTALVEGQSGGITNLNNMNSLQRYQLQVETSPYLVDEDAWFLIAAPSDTGLRIVSRKPIETKAASPDQGFVTDSILYKCRFRERVGATEAIGVFGTPGAS